MTLSKGTILIVDDEQDILQLLDYNISKAGYTTLLADNGLDAIELARKHKPDLILLDRMLPGKDGVQTLQEIRKNSSLSQTIVVFLTALGDEKSEIEGLEYGADDYISKPIKPALLLTRIQTALRRKKGVVELEDENVLTFDNLIINKESYAVTYNKEVFSLAKKEFELLALLASKPERVFLRNEILEIVWGTEVIVGDRTIDVHIRKIRQKLNADFVTTVKGVGYKFEVSKILKN